MITLLIDSGASASFIDKSLVEILRLPFEPAIPAIITIADGNRLYSTSVCKGIQWAMGEVEF